MFVLFYYVSQRWHMSNRRTPGTSSRDLFYGEFVEGRLYLCFKDICKRGIKMSNIDVNGGVCRAANSTHWRLSGAKASAGNGDNEACPKGWEEAEGAGEGGPGWRPSTFTWRLCGGSVTPEFDCTTTNWLVWLMVYYFFSTKPYHNHRYSVNNNIEFLELLYW